MSLIFTVYDLATGRLLRAMEMPTMEAAFLNIDPETEGTIAGWHDPALCYRRMDGEIVALPERPGPWAVFDHVAGAWTDPRAPVDPVQELLARRASAVLSKDAFAERCMDVGLLPPDEAAAASRGEIPDSFLPSMAMLPAEERDRARIKWGGVQRVRRLDPFILAVSAVAGIGADTLDAIFDLTA